MFLSKVSRLQRPRIELLSELLTEQVLLRSFSFVVFASYIHIAADNAYRAVAQIADIAVVEAFVADTVADIVAGWVAALAVVANRVVAE